MCALLRRRSVPACDICVTRSSIAHSSHLKVAPEPSHCKLVSPEACSPSPPCVGFPEALSSPQAPAAPQARPPFPVRSHSPLRYPRHGSRSDCCQKLLCRRSARGELPACSAPRAHELARALHGPRDLAPREPREPPDGEETAHGRPRSRAPRGWGIREGGAPSGGSWLAPRRAGFGHRSGAGRGHSPWRRGLAAWPGRV